MTRRGSPWPADPTPARNISLQFAPRYLPPTPHLASGAIVMSGNSGLGQQAVVLGASVGGLLAARVLSEHFERVIVLERDALTDGLAPRKGVPHARHTHGLLTGGLRVLEDLFPGIKEALVARGAE